MMAIVEAWLCVRLFYTGEPDHDVLPLISACANPAQQL